MAANHYRFGLLLISIAVFSWGILPIALKLSVAFVDPITLTWFRFLVAMVFTLLVQWYTGNINQFKQLKPKDWIMLALIAVFSILNYVTFVDSLQYLAPGQAQLNFQTAPFFLAFGGVLFFKEKLSAIQMSCFATLALGMLLFFHPYLDFSAVSAQSQLWLGVLLIQFSALSWTCFALMQKIMAKRLSPNNILLFIYIFGLLAMLPLSDMNAFTTMDGDQWIIALFCGFNTIAAYGCFAQSMKFLPTAQIGSMIALTPLLTFASTSMVAAMGWWPQSIKADQLDALTMLGILLVILSVVGIQLLPSYLLKRKAKLQLQVS